MQIAVSNELLLVFALALVLTVLLVFLIPAARSRRGSSHGDGPVEEEFADKHVQVTLPWQGYAARVLRLPYPPLDEMPPIEVGGQPWPRSVLLNVVVARQDNPDALVTQFNPPLVLKMAYSTEDLERAKEFKLDYPVFGFWDGCQWVLFTREKHNLSYEPSPDPTLEIAGYASVELAAWNDPAIAKGP
jgi:hypothetical protein